MRIKPMHHNFISPRKTAEFAGVHELYMPESGAVSGQAAKLVGLGFSAEVPEGCAVLVLPRPEVAIKYGVELQTTCGVFTAEHTGEWKVSIKTKSGTGFRWEQEDRILQFIVVPLVDVTLDIDDQT